MEIPLLFLVAGLAVYIIASRAAMRSLSGRKRELLLLILNLAGVYAVFFFDPRVPFHIVRTFIFYVFIVFLQFALLRCFSDSKGWLVWLAFFTPIAVLCVFRYVPDHLVAACGQFLGIKSLRLPQLIGLSYLAFRCSRLVLEVRNGVVARPGFVEYLNFAFFLPTMSIGPINSYANFRRGFEMEPWDVPAGRAMFRIMVGFAKYAFLGGILGRLGYSDFLLNGHPHRWRDLPLAMVFYYLFLYCNFSGFCDIAIGTAGLIGIPVPENFDNPFAARNMKEFWNRWHITLSEWMRDMVFSPLSKILVRVTGVKMADHAIAIAIVTTFLLVGIWHGAGWSFVALGATQALGVVTVHYYTIFLKKRLGRERFKVYNENRFIRALAVSVTFCYVAFSLVFLANNFSDIRRIYSTMNATRFAHPVQLTEGSSR